MPLRKSHLYSSLWQSCDQLRGGMDASQYKDYVLTLLFMKYVSDKYAGSDDFADITVPPGGSFTDMVALKGTKEIGDGINKVIGRLADAGDSNQHLLKGVIDQADFNDESKLGRGKEMQDRLTKLVGIFEGLDFRANRAHGDDLLGDAYEYLMRHFATQSGKSKGQFYTPAEVSRIMAQVIGIGPDTRRDHTVYDPTCGSGSLLIKAADEAPHGLTVYGQEKDVATWTMARMNMILHGRVAAEIERDNTLAAPRFTAGPGRLKRFDFAVANPPFSDKAWTNGLDPANDEYRRFEYGEPPARNGDLGHCSRAGRVHRGALRGRRAPGGRDDRFREGDAGRSEGAAQGGGRRSRRVGGAGCAGGVSGSDEGPRRGEEVDEGGAGQAGLEGARAIRYDDCRGDHRARGRRQVDGQCGGRDRPGGGTPDGWAGGSGQGAGGAVCEAAAEAGAAGGGLRGEGGGSSATNGGGGMSGGFDFERLVELEFKGVVPEFDKRRTVFSVSAGCGWNLMGRWGFNRRRPLNLWAGREPAVDASAPVGSG